MIMFENVVTPSGKQWEILILGARNAMNSWEKSDSGWREWDELSFIPDHIPVKIDEDNNRAFYIGPNDLDLMKRLRNAGTDHRKFMRMITIYANITAPLYWWKEFDTYKVGTVANSCSTMHKLTAKEFTFEDFSHEHLCLDLTLNSLMDKIALLNNLRDVYLNGGILRHANGNMRTYGKKDKEIWYNMIQLLPSSYNQKRTVMINYEVLANIYKSRRNHKLDEWAEHSKEEIVKDALNGKFGFCDWIKTLPYSELITE